jgi:hypothetical protein
MTVTTQESNTIVLNGNKNSFKDVATSLNLRNLPTMKSFPKLGRLRNTTKHAQFMPSTINTTSPYNNNLEKDLYS